MSSEESSNQNWVLGITLGLLGSILINTGNNIQSLGLQRLQNQDKIHTEETDTVVVKKRNRSPSLPSLPKWRNSPPRPSNREPPKRQSLPWLSPVPASKTAPSNNDSNDIDEESEFHVVKLARKTSPVHSMTWVIGTIIFVSGSLLNFASYAFAAQSMLASLESIQFVTNLLFGKFMLGAHITQTMMAGTCLVVTGTVMAVQFSSKETLELSIDDMKKLYVNPAYLSYLGIMVLLLVVLHVIFKKLNEREIAKKPVQHSEIIMPVVYSVSSALVGTQSTVQAKVLAELLAVQASGESNAFASWFLYVTLSAWLVTAVVWLRRLNGALKMFNPLFIIPLIQCSFIFFAIVSGGIFFQEFNAFDLRQWLGFWFGIFVMFAGLTMLTPKPKDGTDDEIHRALVNLLLETRSVSHMSVERTPRSPCPSSVDHQNHSDDIKDLSSNNDEPTERAPRISKENLTNVALDAVKDVFNGDPSSKALSEAMMLHTTDADVRRRRRNALEKLLKLINDDPITSDGFSEEITNLIRELNLDFTVATLPSPGKVDMRDMAKHLSMTQERLHSQILLEIEHNRTPVARELGYAPLST